MAAAASVFISYSSKDADIVNRLKKDLADAGVAVWLDHEQLTPGTRNWQIKVREGIAKAAHVVYGASETAALSDYVFDEISIARNKGKLVIPFWVRGDDWHDCVPLGFGATQRIDGRGVRYQAGLTELLATLGVSVYPLPDVPARLVGLGLRGVNPLGTPAILPPLITVAAGHFRMGSDPARDPVAAKESWAKDEMPQDWVEVAAFQIGKYPVTVAEYRLFLTASQHAEPTSPSNNLTWEQQVRERLDHPVVNVSWQDATAYVAWLREVTGQSGWRLPSEAQWEKAARWDAPRNASRIYPWGDSFDKNRCNTNESGIGKTTPIGSYPANDRQRSGASSYGAEDMAGNVWEWTSSLYKPYHYTENDGREDQDSTGNRVLRGGSWNDGAVYARAAFRVNGRWDYRGYIRGFRLAFRAPAGS